MIKINAWIQSTCIGEYWFKSQTNAHANVGDVLSDETTILTYALGFNEVHLNLKNEVETV